MAAMQMLELQKVNAPAGIEPLHWILLTSLPCTALAQARRIIIFAAPLAHRGISQRPSKAGGVEDSRLTSYRLETLIAVLALVAVRLLNTKLLARACPDQALDVDQMTPGDGLEAKIRKPKEGWTQKSFG